jgi:phosphoglucosamine mutase
MREHHFNLGGEQSGHIILGDHSTTGDGLIAALQVLSAIVVTGRTTGDACRVFDPLPQVLKNIRFKHGAPLQNARVKSAIADAENRLNGVGRLLIRKSGTEPLIRVMAEGEDAVLIEKIVDDLLEVIAETTG